MTDKRITGHASSLLVVFLILFLWLIFPLPGAHAAGNIYDEASFISALTTDDTYTFTSDVTLSTATAAQCTINGHTLTMNLAGHTLSINQTITLGANTNLTFTGGGTVRLMVTKTNMFNQATSNAALTIDGCTIDAQRRGRITNMQSTSAIFTLNSGSLINGKAPTSSQGGGILASYGTVYIHGGTISGCETNNSSGSAIFLGALGSALKADLYMDGGTIENNTVNSGSGTLCISDNGKAYISGGKIINNAAGQTGGGICVVRYLATGSTLLDLSGNTEISGNTALEGGGISVEILSTSLSGSSTVNLSGDVIISNNTANGIGGGIASSTNNQSTINISGNAKITNNTSTGSGGGICVEASVCNISENAQIVNNTSAGSGGGIALTHAAKFTMTGKRLYGNVADISGADLTSLAGCSVTLMSATSMGLPITTVDGWYWDKAGNRYADSTSPVLYTPIANDTQALDLIAGSQTKIIPPQTGDSSHPALYIIFTCLSLIGIAFLMIKYKGHTA